MVTVGMFALEVSATSSSPAASRYCRAKPRHPLKDGDRKMSKRITIDPITRIEGHLRIDVRSRRRQGQQGLGVRPDVARRRADPARPRSARRLGHHPAHLRRVHHGACDHLGARGGKRAADGSAAERAVHPQHDHPAHAIHDHIVHFYHLSALDWVDVTSALKADPDKTAQLGESLSPLERQQQAGDAARCKERLASFRRQRPARHLHQRLLGPSGDEAAARGEPAGRRALPAGAGSPAQGQQDRRASSAPRRRTSRTWRSAASPTRSPRIRSRC